ncbi:MAG: DUF1080 domain-containing protein [Gemmatimonas sp.]|nr:DUF1080 domain-containing protein [Gemmatimonas sp.]
MPRLFRYTWRALPVSVLLLTSCATFRAHAQGGWKPLFDGSSTSAWRGYRSQELPKGWGIEDGVLVKKGTAADIMTRETFGDFELELEWKLEKGGNAGLFYRATEQYDRIYWSGTEYQLLDDANAPDGRTRLTSAGAAYGLYPAAEGALKPAGEWQKTRIVVKKNHVEHWLNGTKVVEYELWSADWKAKVAASKFAKYPKYGLAARGAIGIQGDHNGALSLRHIRIRPLD